MAKLCLLTIKIYWKFNKSFPLPKLYNSKLISMAHLTLSTSKNWIWFLIWCSDLFLCCVSRTYQKLIKDKINLKLRLILERTALTITDDTSAITITSLCVFQPWLTTLGLWHVRVHHNLNWHENSNGN
jgi:hypothetical protein